MGCCVSELSVRTWENTPPLTMEGLRKKGKILKVIDGDTVDLVLEGETYRRRCRLAGIDAPDNDRKEAKKSATQFLESLVLGKIVSVACGKWDKYGRLLVTLYNPQDVNQSMIEYGHAVPYDGGKKG